MGRAISIILLAALMMNVFFGCAENEADNTVANITTASEETISQDSIDPILAQRRDAVESYMRSMATIMWRAEETVNYYIGESELHIVEGRLYRGIPYSYAGANGAVFLGFSDGETDGVHSIGGITVDQLGSNENKTRRVGNDCSGALSCAWGQISTSVVPKSTMHMVSNYGYLRVGSYFSDDSDNTNSAEMCKQNGPAEMYKAYAQLQKADAVVCRDENSGHTMMITSVHVEKNKSGNISGNTSYVTVLHQTSRYIAKDVKKYEEAHGEDVYQTYGIDDKFTFFELYNDGYLPITCRELVDSSVSLEEPWVKDSLEEVNEKTLLTGELTSNYLISFVDVTVRKGEETIQQARAFTDRSFYRTFSFAEFTLRDNLVQGSVDLNKLPAGMCTVTVECELITGKRFTVREFVLDTK